MKNYKQGGDIVFKNVVNKLKMKNKSQLNTGNVYIPKNFEVEEEKKDVDSNEK